MQHQRFSIDIGSRAVAGLVLSYLVFLGVVVTRGYSTGHDAPNPAHELRSIPFQWEDR